MTKMVSPARPSVIHNFIHSDLRDIRCGIFIAAVVIYALAGSPTPDNPGIIEAVIAALLILSAGPEAVYSVIHIHKKQPVLISAGQILMIYGLSIPLLIGIASGHSIQLVLRDIIPFLFLLMPLFFCGLFENQPKFSRLLTAAAVFSGIIFSLRSFMNIIFIPQDFGELYYLANAPTVLFAATLSIGRAMQKFIKSMSLKNFLMLSIMLGLAFIPLLAMSLTLQRASLSIVVFYLLVLGTIAFYRYPARMLWIIVIASLALLPAFSTISDLVEVLARKTSLFGFNMRAQEMAAAWREISFSSGSLLFGTGWGGTFESPAVGGIRVNYTHSLLTSITLKTGLTGLVLVGFYIYGIMRSLALIIKNNPVLGLALAGPFLIDIFLYASFKSFDFGLILLLIAVLAGHTVASRL